MKLGKKIRRYRKQNQLSQLELASKLFVSRQTVSNWENDKCCPDIESIILLSDIFVVTLDEFLKGK